MAKRHWKIEKPDIMTGIKIIETDFTILAKELGALNEAEDLANRAKEQAKEYVSNSDSAIDWILGRQKFTWEDILEAFLHGCRNSEDDTPFLLNEMAFSETKGHYKVLFDPLISFSVFLARAFSLAACSGKDCDAEIRWQLYNGDWISCFCQILPASREIIRILDFRTLDFFLPSINSKEWDSSWNVPALFNQISLISNALKLVGREETAQSFLSEIETRKSAFGLLVELVPTDEPKQKIRDIAEKSWADYLGHRTWENLHNESRNDLIDAFAAEQAVTLGYYRSWQYPLQSLLKVCERELNLSLFIMFKKIYGKLSDFTPKNNRSKSRKTTFNSVVRAIKNDKFLTLGELSFVLKFWNDENMDSCTNLFSLARNFLDQISGNSTNYISVIIEAFKDTYCDTENPPWDLVKLRNSCAHPGNESSLYNPMIIKKLKEVLGEPPKLLIQTIVLRLRGIDD